jgi:hypothetical protein
VESFHQWNKEHPHKNNAGGKACNKNRNIYKARWTLMRKARMNFDWITWPYAFWSFASVLGIFAVAAIYQYISHPHILWFVFLTLVGAELCLTKICVDWLKQRQIVSSVKMPEAIPPPTTRSIKPVASLPPPATAPTTNPFPAIHPTTNKASLPQSVIKASGDLTDALNGMLKARRDLEIYSMGTDRDPSDFTRIWNDITRMGKAIEGAANELAVASLALWPDLSDELRDTLLSLESRDGFRDANLELISKTAKILATNAQAHLLRQESSSAEWINISPDEIVHAEFGSPDIPGSWKAKTKKGEKLADRVKYLFGLPDPVVVEPDVLDMDDPGGVKKHLRLHLSNGTRRTIAVGSILSFANSW